MAAYFASGRVGLLLAFQFESVTPVWPPTGVVLGIALLSGIRYWPAVFAGAFLVNITTSGSLPASLGIAVGNTLEHLVAYFLVMRLAGGGKFLSRMENVVAFALSACLACTISATVGLASLIATGLEARSSAGDIWLTWWLGDVGGALTFAPLTVLWFRHSVQQLSRRQAFEFLLVLLLQVFIGMLLFSNAFIPHPEEYPLAFCAVLPIIWAALRFSSRDTMTVIVLLNLITVFGTINGAGQFAIGSANTSLALVQIFTATVSIIGMALSAARNERMETEYILEQRVAARTGELQATLQQLRATIRHLPLGAMLMDHDGKVLVLNDEYCRMLCGGMPPHEVMKLPRKEMSRLFLHNLADPEGHLQRALAALERKEARLGEEVRLKDGRIISRDLLPIREFGEHQGTLLLYRDVTRERRTDLAKSEFMSLASHQLRTPLTAIRWSLSKLQRGTEALSHEQREKLLVGGLAATKRMAETINTMLKISRIEEDGIALERAEHDVLELLKDKEQIFRDDYVRKNITLDIDCPAGLVVNSDVTFLREILRNLVQNAIKYTPEGGRIVLKAWKDGADVHIAVQDNGYGIPLNQQQRIFEKFYRGENVVERDTQGTGLGLYLVSLLSKALKARIGVVSHEGKGTIFTLSLPPHGN